MSGNSGTGGSGPLTAEAYAWAIHMLTGKAPDAGEDAPESPQQTPRPTGTRSDNEGNDHVDHVQP